MKILNLETTHTVPFKVLFEVLKDMLTETNIIFRSNKKNDDDSETNPADKEKGDESDCMKINAIDPTKTVLINLKLDGINFNKFVCKKSKLLIGINLACFYKLIKSIG